MNMGIRSVTFLICHYHAVAFVFTVIIMSLSTVNGEQNTDSCSPFCPAGWQQWKFSCYKSFYPERVSQKNAVEMCQEVGAHLATPNSDDEYVFMWNNFNPGSVPDAGVWIGCTDEDGDEVWECIGDTKEVRYRAAFNNPTNADEKCAVISKVYFYWNSQDCNKDKNVMCERPLPVTTDSGTCSMVAADRCMLDHTFKTLTVRARAKCCLACLEEQQCRSFNLRGSKCELINSTIPEYRLSEAVSCIHFSLK